MTRLIVSSGFALGCRVRLIEWYRVLCMLENACLWPHLMRDVPVRDVPAPEGRTGVRTQ